MDKRSYNKKARKELFAKNLCEAMREKGITQTGLAEILNTTQQTISRWCKGICEPDYDTLILICGLLGENPNDLLGYDEIKAKSYAVNYIIDKVAESKEYKNFHKACADRYIKKEITLEEERKAEENELKRLYNIYCEKYGL